MGDALPLVSVEIHPARCNRRGHRRRYCEFINNISAARRIAIDLNPETARYAVTGVEVHNIPFSDIASVVGESSVDVAFASNVFEHLRGPEALWRC